MSIQLANALNQTIPVREARETVAGPIVANADILHNVNGDESAIVNVVGTSPVMTLEFTASIDGVNFFAAPAYCLAGAGGTIPSAATPFITDTLAATNTLRVYAVRVSQFKILRVRVSAYTSGTISLVIRSDAQRSVHPVVNDRASTSLFVSASAAVGLTITATLPAVAGLRHYVDFIKVTRSATAALTASATPVLVTTTNLPGSPILTFGQDVAGIGIDKELELDFGGTGLAATAINTATTIVCPAYTGVIWRVNVGYRLGV
jgi:hypothetical protein